MFKCSECVKIFNRKDSLTRHFKTHCDIRYPCKDCSLIFTYKAALTRHVKNKHGAYLKTCIDNTPGTATVSISVENSNSTEAPGDVDDDAMVECLDVLEELGLLNNVDEGKILFCKTI